MRCFSSLSGVGFSLLFLPISIVLSAPAGPNPTVTIASGIIIGTTTRPANQPSLTGQANAYLGVPFAKSPPERFSPPQAAPAWSTALLAQVNTPACIQQFVGSGRSQALTKQYFDAPPPAESEDCLYLNVYTPPGVTPTSKKAVLFWLYGGNLQFGSAGLESYDGSSLALTQDVVVVTINYRTNIFGFSNSPEIARGSQNSGFLDQRFALQWVQKNIAQFGGDPSRVLIFGESAGGESVKQLLANPPSPLPFSAAILQSQNAVIVGKGADSYQDVLEKFDCDSASSPIACLRKVSATDIKAYIESEALGFPPVSGDGTSINDVRSSITSKKWANVPVLFGTNLNEQRIVLAALGLNDNGTEAIDYVFASFGITSASAKKSIFAKYASQGITDDFEVADRLATDLVFTCTTSSLTAFLAKNSYTAYRYHYVPSFPSTTIFPNAGAYHTAEISEVFGTYPLSNEYGDATEQQVKLSAFMQGVWAGFAKSAGSGVGWAKVGSAGGKELGVLGSSSSNGVSVGRSDGIDYACGLYGAVEDALGVSW